MRFSILGPLEIRDATGRVELTSPKQRQLLALLIGRYDVPSGSDLLIEALWTGHPPTAARKALNWHILQLRNTLGADRIVHAAGGYRLMCSPDELDHLRFENLVDEADTVTHAPERASELLRSALALWRGPAYGDLANGLLQEEALRLDELRLTAVEQRGRLELSTGGHAGLIPDLTVLTGQHPFRQELQRQLMLALYRAGRQSEALTVFREVRRRSITELGLEPSPILRDLQRRILSGDTTLDLATSIDSVSRLPRPRQLPADTAAFTGRKPEIERLLKTAAGPGHTVVVSAIDGMAGIGKTALAVHVAHRLADRYPDGQLFIDLQGFSADAAPLRPDDALERLLRSMGTDDNRIPPTTAERSALWRSVLGDRRILLLLDNTADEEHVEPLLPGSPQQFTIITSRRNLSGIDDAALIPLDVLEPETAIDMFFRASGTTADQTGIGAVRRLVDLCSHVPLAIRIMAAQLRTDPGLTVSALVARLEEARTRTIRLAAGRRSVGAALTSSLDHLSPELRQFVVSLAILPNPEFSDHAAAAVTGQSLSLARTRLASLRDVHLVAVTSTGRFRFHDLVWTFLRDRADNDFSDAQHLHMLRSLSDMYQATTELAVVAFGRPLPPTDYTGPIPDIGDRVAALSWLRADQDNILATMWTLIRQSDPVRSWRLLEAYWHYRLEFRDHPVIAPLITRLMSTDATDANPRMKADLLAKLGTDTALRGRHTDAISILQRALTEAKAADSIPITGTVLGALGISQRCIGAYRDALRTQKETLALAEQIDFRPGIAGALANCGVIHECVGEFAIALDYLDRAIAEYRALGDQRAVLLNRGNLGNVMRGLGRIDEALSLHRESVEEYDADIDPSLLAGMFRELCLDHLALNDGEAALRYALRAETLCRDGLDAPSLAATLVCLGNAHLAVNQFDEADSALHEAWAIARQVADRHEVANAHRGLGNLSTRRGDRALAREHWEKAIAIYDALGTTEADGLRRDLDHLGSAQSRLNQPVKP